MYCMYYVNMNIFLWIKEINVVAKVPGTHPCSGIEDLSLISAGDLFA